MPLDAFLAQVEAEIGARLSKFVKEDFEAFLECGILAHCFLRPRCAECAHETLVASFYPPRSCANRATSSIMETKPPVPRAILVGIQVRASTDFVDTGSSGLALCLFGSDIPEGGM